MNLQDLVKYSKICSRICKKNKHRFCADAAKQLGFWCNWKLDLFEVIRTEIIWGPTNFCGACLKQMSRLQGHVEWHIVSLSKLLLSDTYFLIEDTNSHSTPFSSFLLRTSYSLFNANSNFVSLVLWIMFLLILADR